MGEVVLVYESHQRYKLSFQEISLKAVNGKFFDAVFPLLNRILLQRINLQFRPERWII
jgi:hypothetical protein